MEKSYNFLDVNVCITDVIFIDSVKWQGIAVFYLKTESFLWDVGMM